MVQEPRGGGVEACMRLYLYHVYYVYFKFRNSESGGFTYVGVHSQSTLSLSHTLTYLTSGQAAVRSFLPLGHPSSSFSLDEN